MSRAEVRVSPRIAGVGGPPWADALIAAAVGAVELPWMVVVAEGQHSARQLDDLGFALLGVGVLVLVVRRRFPQAVFCTTGLALVAYLGLRYPQGPVPVTAGVALFTLSDTGHRMRGLVSAIGLLAVLSAMASVAGYPTTNPFLGMVIFFLAALLLGYGSNLLRSQLAEVRRWALELERAREEEARRRAGEERLRIARDLHDLIAHNIALINIHARVASRALGEDRPETAAALEVIKDTSKQTLGELRTTIGVLRDVGEQAPLRPGPSLSRLDELVASVTAAGATVDVQQEGEPRALSEEVDMAAYRIVQEALTNVLRHAVPAHARVRMTYGEGELDVQVCDSGSAEGGPGRPAAERVGGGRGLVGMRERALAVGGRFEAGPHPDGGFRVHVRLPLGTDA